MPKPMPKMITLFSHCYDSLTDQQLKWRPVVSRSSTQPLEFFKNWKKAPKDCPYHVIGKQICRLARGFRSRVDADIEAEFGYGPNNKFGDILLRQRQKYWGHELYDSVECRVRVTPAFVEAEKRKQAENRKAKSRQTVSKPDRR